MRGTVWVVKANGSGVAHIREDSGGRDELACGRMLSPDATRIASSTHRRCGKCVAWDTSSLANAIRDMSAAVRRLESSGGLNRTAVVILLAHHSRVNITTVRAVLKGLGEMEKAYCNG